jgi:uncharacterized RDD family membrane protein YckC
MTCPSCRVHVGAGASRCGACGAILAVPTEGALAPDLSRHAPMRELPGTRKPQRTWKDEVRERVHTRRQAKAGDPPGLEGDEARAEDAHIEMGRPEGTLIDLGDDRGVSADGAPYAVTEKFGRGTPSASGELALDLLDFPLGTPTEAPPAPPAPSAPPALSLDQPPVAPAALPLSDERTVAPAEPVLHREREVRRPVERVVEPDPADEDAALDESGPLPSLGLAGPGERLLAASIDLALWAATSVLVVYFASRVAHVKIAGLIVAWPWMGAFLAFLGIVYAVWFTGTTGQTIGKIATGLRVVDVLGRPPSSARALLRASVGVLGVLCAFAGVVPVLLGRPSLHDRLAGTRVVRA